MQPMAMVNATSGVDSPYAWTRLLAALLIGGIGGVGMWSVAVVLPAVQAEFGVARGAASLPYAVTMLGLAVGGMLYGRLLDKVGIRPVLAMGAVFLAFGFALASFATSLWQFVLIQGVVIGALGTSTTFSPLVADITFWFEKRRGLAVALCASGNYLAGAVWPWLLESWVRLYGWRTAYLIVAATCLALMLPLLLVFRRPTQRGALTAGGTSGVDGGGIGMNPRALQALLMLAGVSCCVAMSMPQVHIVAYCGDLGYGVKVGAEMLSLMMAAGIISRLVSGWICDHIGGIATLLLGSTLQCLALLAFLPFDSVTGLYVVSAMFGLAQGGIVPSYAIVAREVFPAAEAGTRISAVLMSTIVGMALGGWLSGLIFDFTGSYRAAFLNGIAWSLLNIAIALYLFNRRYRRDDARLAAA